MPSCVNRKLLAGVRGDSSAGDLQSEVSVAGETQGGIIHVHNKACR